MRVAPGIGARTGVGADVDAVATGIDKAVDEDEAAVVDGDGAVFPAVSSGDSESGVTSEEVFWVVAEEDGSKFCLQGSGLDLRVDPSSSERAKGFNRAHHAPKLLFRDSCFLRRVDSICDSSSLSGLESHCNGVALLGPRWGVGELGGDARTGS